MNRPKPGNVIMMGIIAPNNVNMRVKNMNANGDTVGGHSAGSPTSAPYSTPIKIAVVTCDKSHCDLPQLNPAFEDQYALLLRSIVVLVPGHVHPMQLQR
ncbi:hypothetical protein DERP_011163 [Dermatophagoides pteronyssinus]|uniref:Uncharacterized protein n=1 Tax=Dermatophagoides pteronyssinus TaxID=6956 RepID=A0ABQ8J922_DERPT|nr:hypothetical protein DERP_011163 [Dermatophagoides pteronyssinus]